jgi:branched-chain amino acid transport system permease protein
VVGWFASTHFNEVSFRFLSALPDQTGGRELPGIHVSFWILLLAAGAFAALWGVIIGAPTLRLRGDYLAIVTLGFGEIIPRFFLNGDNILGYNLTNGTIGIKGIDSPGIPFGPRTWQQFGTLDLNPWYYTILVLVLVTIFINIRLRDSRLGRAWMAVREDETAAAAMGVRPGCDLRGAGGGVLRHVHKEHLPDELLVQHLCLGPVHGHPWRYGEHLRCDPGRHPPSGDQLLSLTAN